MDMVRAFHLSANDQAKTCLVTRKGGSFCVTPEGSQTAIVVEGGDDASSWLRSFIVDGEEKKIGVRRVGDGLQVIVDGEVYDFEVKDPRSMRYAAVTEHAAVQRKEVIKAPMPGMIVKVLVSEGEEVEKGQPLVILNAMKLENDIRAPRAGKVHGVHVESEQAVEKGVKLVTVE